MRGTCDCQQNDPCPACGFSILCDCSGLTGPLDKLHKHNILMGAKLRSFEGHSLIVLL